MSASAVIVGPLLGMLISLVGLVFTLWSIKMRRRAVEGFDRCRALLLKNDPLSTSLWLDAVSRHIEFLSWLNYFHLLGTTLSFIGALWCVAHIPAR